MKYFAYHRTSTQDQHLDRGIKEIDEYTKANNIKLHNKVYTDQQTGKNFDRPSYIKMIEDMEYQLEQGNKVALIVTELDRLGRDKQLTLSEIRKMQEKGVRLMVLEIPTTLTILEKFDNNMAVMMMETINNMLIEMYASFAQAEMEKKEKRQREGIAAKKARGEWEEYGRPRRLDKKDFAKYYKRVLKKELKPVEVMELLNIPKPTYYRYAREYNQENS